MDYFLVIVSLVCIWIFIFAAYFPCLLDLLVSNKYQEGLDTNIKLISIPTTGIPNGYYRIDSQNMAEVPNGFSVTADKKTIYPTISTGKIPIPPSGIPYGYYQIDYMNMAMVPSGYIASADKTKIFPVDKDQIYSNYVNSLSGNSVSSNSSITQNTNFSNTKYDNDISKLMNIEYHPSEDIIRAQEGGDTSSQLNNTWIMDNSGNRILYPNTNVQGSITYYTPGSYPFGTANYVPRYDDAIYLSQSTGLDTSMPLKNTAEMMRGFCSYHQFNVPKIEENCRSLDKNACASTSCCVLLGGASCVAGNETGPIHTSHYGDVYVRNKDFYYYQSKCYGNC